MCFETFGLSYHNFLYYEMQIFPMQMGFSWS